MVRIDNQTHEVTYEGAEGKPVSSSVPLGPSAGQHYPVVVAWNPMFLPGQVLHANQFNNGHSQLLQHLGNLQQQSYIAEIGQEFAVASPPYNKKTMETFSPPAPEPIAQKVIANILATHAPDRLQGRGKEAAAFALAYAFNTPVPDGWKEPDWRDTLNAPMVPGMRPGLRLPKVRPQYALAGLNFGMVVLNVPLILTGHLFNDFAAAFAAFAGTALVVSTRRLANVHARALT